MVTNAAWETAERTERMIRDVVGFVDDFAEFYGTSRAEAVMVIVGCASTLLTLNDEELDKLLKAKAELRVQIEKDPNQVKEIK